MLGKIRVESEKSRAKHRRNNVSSKIRLMSLRAAQRLIEIG